MKVGGQSPIHELLADGFAVHVQFLTPDSRELIVSGRDGETAASHVAASGAGGSTELSRTSRAPRGTLLNCRCLSGA